MSIDPDLIREIGISLSGLVAGISLVANLQYRNEYKTAEDGRKRSLQMAGWTAMTLGVLALFQGFARVFLIGENSPLDWKDWGVILLQLNSLLLLVTMMRHERQWCDHDD